MVEREHGTGRVAGTERHDVVAHPAGFEPEVVPDEVPARPGRLAPRPDEGLTFAAALDETMRDHRAVFTALAK